jgi:hypothetical protein
MTVKVTVAVYRPGATKGSGETNPTFAAHASPVAELGAEVVPISKSAAGAIGIAAIAPSASSPPS